MPAAVAIPLALAGATMVAQNVQNKAAQKNNDNQQHAATQNAQAAWQHAQAQLAQWMQSNPAPFSGGMNIARPTPYGATPPSPTVSRQAPSTVQAPQASPPPSTATPAPPTAGARPPINPVLLQHLLAVMHRGPVGGGRMML